MSSNHGGEVSNVGSGSKPISNCYEIVPYDNKRVSMGMGIKVPGLSKAVGGDAGGVGARKDVKDASFVSVHRYGSLPQLTSSTNIVSNQDWENPFAMNASVAFGGNDWDDFVKESGDTVGVPLIWDRYEKTEPHFGSEKNLMSVPHCTPVESTELEKNRLDYVSEADQQTQNGKRIELNSQKDVTDTIVDESVEYLNTCTITNVFENDSAALEKPQVLEMKAGLGTKECRIEANYSPLESEEPNDFNTRKYRGSRDLETCDANSGSPCGSNLTHHLRTPSKIDHELTEDYFPNSVAFDLLETEVISESNSLLLFEATNKENISSTKSDSVEPNEFIADVLHEMEEILLDSAESPGPRASHGKRPFNFEGPGLTASHTDLDDDGSFIRHTTKFDGVEVIGAKQKKGNVSLSERLVGVKEYTVYIIRVWIGTDHWEVERRYRDFIRLYHCLKSFFGDQGLNLPSEWSSIERESSKIFGSASPDVVAERSRLIEDCIRSILHFEAPDALLLFLSPRDLFFTEKISNLGKTVALIVENRQYVSVKQLLEAQHYCCAGCHRHFDDRRNLVRDFVQKFGWGKPRLCEYTGQLFCSSCHTNQTAVLPSRALHSWDFTEYPVCQLAKFYLDSIHDKPVLCVSAVNPLLFAKVPGLFHVMGTRRKIRSMLSFVRCPFRISIDNGLGSRRYLIESNDFFALRDLIDLSKGAFAALPTMLETVSRKILEHITEQCLICCDVGTPCGAKQACQDPSSLMFPFQEDEIHKCGSCNAVFHTKCFKRVAKCYCQLQVDTSAVVDPSQNFLPMRSSGSTLLSRLFPKVKSDKTKDPMMASFPSNSIDDL